MVLFLWNTYCFDPVIQRRTPTATPILCCLRGVVYNSPLGPATKKSGPTSYVRIRLVVNTTCIFRPVPSTVLNIWVCRPVPSRVFIFTAPPFRRGKMVVNFTVPSSRENVYLPPRPVVEKNRVYFTVPSHGENKYVGPSVPSRPVPLNCCTAIDCSVPSRLDNLCDCHFTVSPSNIIFRQTSQKQYPPSRVDYQIP